MVKAKEYRSHDSSHFSTHVSIAASSPLSPSINGEFSPSPYHRSLLPLVTIAALFSSKCYLSLWYLYRTKVWAHLVQHLLRAPVSTTSISTRTTDVPIDAYGQAASNLVAGDNMDQIVQQLMDMGGGSWDKDIVTRALLAAYNNPERAVDYLYSDIPEVTEIAVPVPNFQSNLESGGTEPTALARDAPLSGVPNSSPLNLFPREALNAGAGVGDGSLDYPRNNQQVMSSADPGMGLKGKHNEVMDMVVNLTVMAS